MPKIKRVGPAIYGDSIVDLFFGVLTLISEDPPRKSYQNKLVSLESLNPDEILKADEHNFAIPNSEIIKIELKYGWWNVKAELNVATSNKKYQCFLKDIPSKAEKKRRAEHCENILRPIFRDKLSVKK